MTRWYFVAYMVKKESRTLYGDVILNVELKDIENFNDDIRSKIQEKHGSDNVALTSITEVRV